MSRDAASPSSPTPSSSSSITAAADAPSRSPLPPRSRSRSDAAIAASHAVDLNRQLRLARVDRTVLQEREREARLRIRTAEEDIFADHLVPYHLLLQHQLHSCRSSASVSRSRSYRSASQEMGASRQSFMPLWGCYPTLSSSFVSYAPSPAKKMEMEGGSDVGSAQERQLRSASPSHEGVAHPVSSSFGSLSSAVAPNSSSFLTAAATRLEQLQRMEGITTEPSALAAHSSYSRASALHLKHSEGGGGGKSCESYEEPDVLGSSLRASAFSSSSSTPPSVTSPDCPFFKTCNGGTDVDRATADTSPPPRNPTLHFTVPVAAVSHPSSREEWEAPPASARTEAPCADVWEPSDEDSVRGDLRVSTSFTTSSSGSDAADDCTTSSDIREGVGESSEPDEHSSSTAYSSRSLFSCYSELSGPRRALVQSCSVLLASESAGGGAVQTSRDDAIKAQGEGFSGGGEPVMEDSHAVQPEAVPIGISGPARSASEACKSGSLCAATASPVNPAVDASTIAATLESTDSVKVVPAGVHQLEQMCTRPSLTRTSASISETGTAGGFGTPTAAVAAAATHSTPPPPRSHSLRASATPSIVLPRLTRQHQGRSNTSHKSRELHNGPSAGEKNSTALASSPQSFTSARTPLRGEESRVPRSAPSTVERREVAAQLFPREDEERVVPPTLSTSAATHPVHVSPRFTAQSTSLLTATPPLPSTRSPTPSRSLSYALPRYPNLSWVGSFSALQAEECVRRASLCATEYYEWSHHVGVRKINYGDA